MKIPNLLNIILAAALLIVSVKMVADGRSKNSPKAAETEEVAATDESPDEPTASTGNGTFKEFDVEQDFSANAFHFFRGSGLLLAAGDKGKSNAMTIGWGALGTLWGKSTVTVYVAEGRYTKQFMDRSPYFTVMTFMNDSILQYMGSHSGRDGDKAAALGLHTLYTDNGAPYYAEAELVFECRLLYAAPFDPKAFKDNLPRDFYANRADAGIHTMYIGEVVRAMRKE